MSIVNTPEVDVLGGGYGGYGGGFGNNPLLWLITLGFLKGDGLGFGNNGAGAGAGVLAGEAQAKLDCLAQGQQALARDIEQSESSAQFRDLSGQITEAGQVARDNRDLMTTQLTTLAQSLASCCCDLKAGQQSIQTAIAMQTNDLNTVATANTQKILDALCAGRLEQKDSEIRRLQDALQTQTIVANCNGGNHNGGGGIDINVIAAALARAGQPATATATPAA